MAQLNNLLERLVRIHKECIDPALAKKEKEKEKELDDFARKKMKINGDIKETRNWLEERNELMRKGGEDSNDVVRKSADVRKRIKQLKRDAEELADIQRKDKDKLNKKKKKTSPDSENKTKLSKKRDELVELCFLHIEECSNLEKMRHQDMYDGDDKKLDLENPTITKLPDLEGDDLLLQLVQDEEQLINPKLEQVEEGVKVLKEMAISYGEELEVQNMMISEVESEVEKTTAQMENLNKRLRKTLRNVRKGNRFIIDFILLVVLLAIAGYIYNMVTK